MALFLCACVGYFAQVYAVQGKTATGLMPCSVLVLSAAAGVKQVLPVPRSFCLIWHLDDGISKSGGWAAKCHFGTTDVPTSDVCLIPVVRRTVATAPVPLWPGRPCTRNKYTYLLRTSVFDGSSFPFLVSTFSVFSNRLVLSMYGVCHGSTW